MWTLQEGVLARALYFQMSDGVFPFTNVLKLSRTSIFETSPLLFECSSVLGEIMLNKAMTGSKKNQLDLESSQNAYDELLQRLPSGIRLPA